jgi:bifunctional non-homologous end joining protein LigD
LQLLKPMLASLADAPLQNPQLVYEPKYDGIRAIAEVSPAGVRLWSRLGNEKTAQFPEIARALAKWARRQRAPVVLDGEIVALDAKGHPTGFQRLQGRIHLTGEDLPADSSAVATAFILFDILRDGSRDLRDLPLLERRQILERLFARNRDAVLRISEMVRGDGRALYHRALEQGWEGLIAKRADSVYKSGKRTPDWCKLKIVQEQEFVVGGWTEPRQTRTYFGALLLGVYEGPDLIYVGHTGTGFNERELARVMKLMQPLETDVCPFRQRPRTNERPHWVVPQLVAQIKFTEWTADGKLRHPVYLGLRDDKNPRDVVREPAARRVNVARGRVRLTADTTRATARSVVSGFSRTGNSQTRSATGTALVSGFSRTTSSPKTHVVSGFSRTESTPTPDALIDQLLALEDGRRDGTLDLPGGKRLAVTNLHKVFWPKAKLTKGDLLRFYVQVAPCILPALADRPLVMKRFPNGVLAKPFYQHRVADTPAGVRVERVEVAEQREQLIGGDLLTLLYATQLAAISQDPWFSRVQSPEFADYAALDLDPMPGVPFSRTLEVARWIHDELQSLGAGAVPKTSGADGLHIYIPLPRGTPYEAGLIYCQIVATVVAQKHPRHATIERAVAARGKRVYVDYMQNVLGKTLVSAYSARASEFAGVSTPLTWAEVHAGIDREQLTVRTVPARLKDVGDLWTPVRTSKGVDLQAVSRYLDKTTGRLKGDSR